MTVQGRRAGLGGASQVRGVREGFLEDEMSTPGAEDEEESSR